MRPIRPVAFVAALLAASSLAPAQSGDSVDLRPMWEDGQTSRYQLTQVQDRQIEATGMGGPQDMSSEVEGEITWRVTRANPGGGGEAEFTVDDLSMTVTGPDGERFTVTPRGGGNELTEPLRQYLDALVGATLQVSVAEDGTVSRLRGYRSIQQRAGDMGRTLDEEYFTNMVQDVAVLVGGRAEARRGDDWGRRHESQHAAGLGVLHYDATYTLAGVEYIAGIPVAFINREADVDFEADLSDLPAEAPPVDVRVRDASQSAQIVFDLSRGEVVGLNSDQVLALEISTSFGGESFTQSLREVSNTRLLRISED